MFDFLRYASVYKNISQIFEVLCGGIYKRIDENRELLELLQDDAPLFLEQHFWVVGWLKAQDDFLVYLSRLIPTKNQLVLSGKYPRKWPEKNV